MRYGSVCSGIEAATVAWHDIPGWQPQWFAEIEAFPSAVLKHHYAAVPNLGDFTQIGVQDEPGAIELLVGGTPCQSFSVAGKRLGLDDPRGNLAIEFLRLAQRTRPRWLLFENVPGLLSSDRGRDFYTFLNLMGQCGYGYAYRVLDAQYFGVPQRRRRVFVVGYFGDWRPAAAVLLERESLSRHPAPRREAGERITGTIDTGFGERGGAGLSPNGLTATTYGFSAGQSAAAGSIGGRDEQAPTLKGAPSGSNQVPAIARSQRARPNASHREDSDNYIPYVSGTLNVGGKAAGYATQQDAETGLLMAACVTSRQTRLDAESQTLIAFSAKDNGRDATYNLSPTMRGSGCGNSHADSSKWVGLQLGMSVRRLTPRECERLQGFPDDYTLIPYRGKPAADGLRYKALGNSMAVPVMKWLGERIAAVDSIVRAA